MPTDETKCVICSKPKSRADCEIFKLTAEEQMAIRASGEKPPKEIAYCRPCHRLISNQQTALDLLKGMVQMRLRAAGVSNAEELATQFKNKLAEKSKPSK